MNVRRPSLLLAALVVTFAALPAQAHDRGHRHDDSRWEYSQHGHHHHRHYRSAAPWVREYRPAYVYGPPAVVYQPAYAPPAVIYQPAYPVYRAQPVISFGIDLPLR